MEKFQNMDFLKILSAITILKITVFFIIQLFIIKPFLIDLNFF